MAELIWSLRAERDIYGIIDYIAADNPKAAIKVSKLIQSSAERLRRFPRQGKPGRAEGTRELVVTNTPYVLIYIVKNDRVMIARVMHQAQSWPPIIQEPDEE